MKWNELPHRIAAVCVVPVYFTDRGAVEHVCDAIARAFAVPVWVSGRRVDIHRAFDPARRQFDAHEFQRLLIGEARGGVVIGLTELDLCNRVLSFVYGQAQVGGSVAVASACRLREHGRWRSRRRFLGRLGKEVVHEVGHLAGLTHCPDRRCVMASSSCVADIDLKDAGFCLECQYRLGRLGSTMSVAPPPTTLGVHA